jgi:hypothetical protein
MLNVLWIKTKNIWNHGQESFLVSANPPDLVLLVIVSEIMIYFNLDKNIECEKICRSIQDLIDKHYKNMNLSNHVIVIQIKETIPDNSLIPKLEHKP